MSRYTGKPHVRTNQQSKALHKYYELLAIELNNAGITVQKFLKQSIDIDWNAHTIKELIWRPLQEHLTGKKSTTELDKVTEITEIWEQINRHIGQNWGLYVRFPARDPENIAPTNEDYN